MDKISIVVAVYNAEKYLKKCIESLLNQTYDNFEIILVNDSSTDNSLEICNQYSNLHSNVFTFSNERNVGVSATRNRGIDISSGEYICFVDSDDYVEPNYVEKLITCYKKYNTVPICGFVYHDEVNNRDPVHYYWSGGDELVSLGEAFRLNSELYLTALWNKLFDNNLVKSNNIRFDENLSMGEDLRFSVEYFQKTNTSEVYVFCEPLYHYTKLSDGTLMSNYARNGIDDGIKSIELIKVLAKKFNPNASEEYIVAVENLKNNLKYFLIRDKKYSWKTQYSKIKSIYLEYNYFYFFIDKLKYLKEKIMN